MLWATVHHTLSECSCHCIRQMSTINGENRVVETTSSRETSRAAASQLGVVKGGKRDQRLTRTLKIYEHENYKQLGLMTETTSAKRDYNAHAQAGKDGSTSGTYHAGVQGTGGCSDAACPTGLGRRLFDRSRQRVINIRRAYADI